MAPFVAAARPLVGTVVPGAARRWQGARMQSLRALVVLAVSLADPACSGAPAPTGRAGAEMRRGRVDVATVHGASLEHTATGENPDRRVSVYVPPSYATDARHRYPVVYLLHGIFDTDAVWTGNDQPWSSVQDVMDRGIAEDCSAS